MEVKNYKFWFCTGSQDLYGDECLANVAAHSKQIVEALNASGKLPFEVVLKPTLIQMNLSEKHLMKLTMILNVQVLLHGCIHFHLQNHGF